MPAPDPDDSERDYSPPIWRAVPQKKAETPELPISRHVKLSEKVSVRFLAETTGETLYNIAMVMNRLRICIDVDRSVDFVDAAKILRQYGIGAEKEA